MNRVGIKPFLVFCTLFGFISPSLADEEDSHFACTDSANVMDCIEKTKINTVTPVQTAPAALANPNWIHYGPLSLGFRYDTVLGWIPEMKYLQLFYDNGLNLILNYGPNEQRANITLGHFFSPRQQIKITYEYLAQNLSYDFVSGSTTQWVNQNAVGAAYQYLLSDGFFHGVDVNGYYIRANSKNLSNVVFYQNNDAYLNLRRIAGGTEETVLTNLSMTPYHNILMSLGVGYSHLVYDTEYENDQDTSTLAYTAGLEYLLSAHTKLNADFKRDAAEMDTNLKISQILPANLEASISGQYSEGQAGQPNSTTIGLALSYPASNYTFSHSDNLATLKSWIQNPIVFSSRVLAIKDEKKILYAIYSQNPPAQNVQTGQLIQAINTKDIFNFDSALFSKVEYSLSLVDSNGQPLPNTAQSLLNIDLKQDGGSVYNDILYSTGPVQNLATPNGGSNSYHVIITATGYQNGLTQPIQAKADFLLNVNYNSQNEPQWSNKTDGSIAFDSTSIPSSIYLNSYLSTPVSQGVTFTLTGSSTQNWDIKSDSSGNWYLIRKTNNGAYDVSDVSSSSQSYQYVTVTAKYANDPDGVPGAIQQLSLKVLPDDNIQLAWDTNCQLQNVLHNLVAIQPENNNFYTLDLKQAQCLVYLDQAQHPMKINGDNPSFLSITNDGGYYKTQPNGNGMNLNNNLLTVNGPIKGLKSQYSVGLSVKSLAASKELPVAANNLITVGDTLTVNAIPGDSSGNSGNLFVFSQTQGNVILLNQTSLAVDSLIPGKTSYQLIAIKRDDNINDSMMECTGKVYNLDSYLSCTTSGQAASLALNTDFKIAPDSSGKVSIIWNNTENNQVYAKITSITIKDTSSSTSINHR